MTDSLKEPKCFKDRHSTLILTDGAETEKLRGDIKTCLCADGNAPEQR